MDRLSYPSLLAASRVMGCLTLATATSKEGIGVVRMYTTSNAAPLSAAAFFDAMGAFGSALISERSK